MRFQPTALAAALSMILGAQIVHGAGLAPQGRQLPRAAAAPPSFQTPTPPPPPRAPQAPPSSPAPPPVILPFQPLMRPPAGGLTPGFVFVPTDPTQPPPDMFLAGRPAPSGSTFVAPFGSPFYAPFFGGYAIAGPGETARPAPVQPVTGVLRLSVTPASAQVFVDSYYVGTVENIEAQRFITLVAGPHRIEIRAPEYQTLTFDIRITPYEIVSYRGALERIRPAVAAVPATAASQGPMYVIPNCYIGNVPPRPIRLPSGCDIKQMQVLGRR